MEAALNTDSEKIEIFLSCRNLRDLDTFSKSDPKVKVSLFTQGKEASLGVTEVKKNDLNPDFSKTFIFQYFFEKRQSLKLDVWDHDTNDADDYLGGAEVNVATLMGARNQLILNGKPAGTITVRADKIQESNKFVWWQWSGSKIKNVDGWFGKSDPFLRFYKKGSGLDWLLIHQSEWLHNNPDPIFKPFEIAAARLAPNPTDVFKVECWDHEDSEKHKIIGSFEATHDEAFNKKKTQFTIVDPKHKPAGTLTIMNLKVDERPGFVDYLRGGEQLNMIVAIDFTGSNGDPKQPSSLHAIKNDGTLNQYQSAIFEVCDILLNYDYDKRVPVWGFGAKPKIPGVPAVVNHCFSLSGNPESPEVLGLQGIMEAYMNTIFNVDFSGPTYFKYIINSAMQVAQANEPSNIYTVLLILTDGEIHDMDDTINLITKSATLPLSIIIVGVGNEKFANMRTLDGDDGDKGSKKRDLVQFVAFNDYKGNTSMLAQEVLAELPRQLVEYKLLVGKKPGVPMIIQMEKMQI